MFVTTRKVEWGDCDPAGIIFYPNYYRYMDGAFQEMAAACGFSQKSLREDHGLIGTPLADTGCRFVSPAMLDDALTIEATVARIGTSSLKLAYRFLAGERLTAEGFEARVFARPAGEGIEKAPIPDEIRLALGRV